MDLVYPFKTPCTTQPMTDGYRVLNHPCLFPKLIALSNRFGRSSIPILSYLQPETNGFRVFLSIHISLPSPLQPEAHGLRVFLPSCSSSHPPTGSQWFLSILVRTHIFFLPSPTGSQWFPSINGLTPLLSPARRSWPLSTHSFPPVLLKFSLSNLNSSSLRSPLTQHFPSHSQNQARLRPR